MNTQAWIWHVPKLSFCMVKNRHHRPPRAPSGADQACGMAPLFPLHMGKLGRPGMATGPCPCQCNPRIPDPAPANGPGGHELAPARIPDPWYPFRSPARAIHQAGSRPGKVFFFVSVLSWPPCAAVFALAYACQAAAPVLSAATPPTPPPSHWHHTGAIQAGMPAATCVAPNNLIPAAKYPERAQSGAGLWFPLTGGGFYAGYKGWPWGSPGSGGPATVAPGAQSAAFRGLARNCVCACLSMVALALFIRNTRPPSETRHSAPQPPTHPHRIRGPFRSARLRGVAFA